MSARRCFTWNTRGARQLEDEVAHIESDADGVDSNVRCCVPVDIDAKRNNSPDTSVQASPAVVKIGAAARKQKPWLPDTVAFASMHDRSILSCPLTKFLIVLRRISVLPDGLGWRSGSFLAPPNRRLLPGPPMSESSPCVEIAGAPPKSV